MFGLGAEHNSLDQDDKPMARVPQLASGKFSYSLGIHCCPNFFFARLMSLYSEEYVYIYTYVTPYRLYINYLCYRIILSFYTNRKRCEVITGYLSLGCRPGGDWANT
jgi:hypothetical protein